MIDPNNIHRQLALAFAAVFLMFNIGLPIVVASCTMTQNSGRAACSQCVPLARSSGSSVERQINRSCCATVIAAGRNTTEFLRGNDQTPQLLSFQVTVTIPEIAALASSLFVPRFVVLSRPHPRSEDIPVFTSALLI